MRIYFKYLCYLIIAIGVSSSNAGAYEDFFRAIEVDNASTVSQLLQRGFDPNAPDEKGQRALFLAMRAQSYKVAQALLVHPDIKVDLANDAGETALMMAALRGSAEWCQRLIDRGASVNRTGWTPLHYAASGPGAAAVKLLLDRGALVDAPSPNGSTALMMAARYGSEDAVDVLLGRSADARLRNERNMNAADFARSAGRESLATRLEQRAR